MRMIRVWVAALVGAASAASLSSCAPGGPSPGAGNGALVTMVTTTIPGATTGVSYDTVFDADFPHPPGIFLVTGGALPPGLTLDENSGRLKGYPRQTGLFHFEVGARDGADEIPRGGTLPPGRDANFAEDRRIFSMDVTLGLPRILPQQPPACQYRAPYAYQIDVAGGTAPYTFAQTGGTLPAGISVSASGLLGTFATQAQPTPYAFTVTLTDAAGLTDVEPLTLQVVVLPLIVLTSNPIAEAAIGFPYDLPLVLASGGGGGPYAWSQHFPLAAGETDLASIGMEITANGHFQNRAPNPGPVGLPGTYNFTAEVVDEALQHALRPLSFKTNLGPVLTSITPNRASASPPYVVAGANFQPGAQLIFKPGPGQVSVTPQFVNSSTLQVNSVPATPAGGGFVAVMVRNPDSGTFTKPAAFIFSLSSLTFGTKGFISSGISSTGLDCADVNGDGLADVVHSGAAGINNYPYGAGVTSNAGGLVLHMNLGGSPPTFGATTLDAANFYDVKFVDLDANGTLDVVALGQTSVKTWLNNPLGTFTAGPVSALPALPTITVPAAYGAAPAPFPAEMAIGKLTPDAIPDLVFCVSTYPNIAGRVYSMSGNGSGGFTLLDSAVGNMSPTLGVLSVACLDLDGDGRSDVVASQGFHNGGGQVFHRETTQASGLFGTWTTVGAGLSYANTTGVAAGDLLGTGVPAIIAVHTQDLTDGGNRRVFRYSGAGTLATVFQEPDPLALGKSVAVFDGDFDLPKDFAVSTTTGNLVVYRGVTSTIAQTLVVTIGSPTVTSSRTGRVASGDLDGDGRNDILVTNSYWAVDYQPNLYSGSYALNLAGNGNPLGVVFYLNTSN